MHAEPRTPRRVRVERGIYRNPSTGGFEIQYTDSARRVRWQRVAGGLREARFARAEIQTRLGRGELVTRANRTLAEVGEEWLAAQHHLRPRTRQLYRTALDRHIFPRLGSRRISDINEDRIAHLVLQLEQQGLSGWTVRGVLTPLGRILNYAARRGLIPDNPISRLEAAERPKVIRREMRILRPEEIDALLTVATPAYRAILATAIFTGLRQGELLGLTWADINFEVGVVHVRCQLDRGGSRVAPKTRQALRDVILMPSLASLLGEHKLASGHSLPSDPVFATLTGQPMYFRNVTRRGLAAAVKRAGLDGEGDPRLRFHDLRHAFASLLIAEGLNVVFISRQLGHASPSFTLDTYGGLFDRAEHSRRAVEGLETNFGKLLGGTT
jgi:integrase